MSFKNFLKLFLALVILVTVCPALYNFTVLGQKDFGLSKSYRYCQNGIYSTYPRGVSDGGTSYYDKNDDKIGQCNSWVPGPTCEPAKTAAGICTEKGFRPLW